MRPLVWILAAFGLVLLATAEAARPQLPRAGNMRYRPLPRVVRDFGNEGPPVDRRSHFLSARQFPGYATDNATMVLLEEVTGEDSGYDAYTPPYYGTGAVNVTIQYRINNLFDVDPVSSTFTIDVFLRLYWTDPRLIVSREDLPSSNGSDYRVLGSVSLGNGIDAPSRVWTPDVYFGNEVAPNLLNEVLKLSPYTGEMFWSRHFVVQLTNTYVLTTFPFDRQTLTLQLVSYSYNENQMNLFWRDEAGGGPVFPPTDPKTFSAVTWDYLGYAVDKVRYFSRQGQPAYDLMIYNISISRKAGSYYIKSFMPLGLLVALTVVSYWFSVDAVPERLGLSITLVLTIVSFYNSVTAGLPMVNYATTIDWYVFISFVVAFFSLLEIALIHHLVQRRNNRIVATELDMFCRRFVLPFWLLFNIGILVQLPADSFPWLWVLVGVLSGILLLVNLWLFAYYVWKRYDTRLFLEKSIYGKEHLELSGDDMQGRVDIGEQDSFKRKFHDYVLRSTDRLFKALHIAIPGEKVRKDLAEGTYNPDGYVDDREGGPGVSERDRIDRVSLDMDVARAREEEVMLRVRDAQTSGNLQSPVLLVGDMPRSRRRASIIKVDGIEVALPAGSGNALGSRVIRTESGGLSVAARPPSGGISASGMNNRGTFGKTPTGASDPPMSPTLTVTEHGVGDTYDHDLPLPSLERTKPAPVPTIVLGTTSPTMPLGSSEPLHVVPPEDDDGEEEVID